jgi:hypothetical protein
MSDEKTKTDLARRAVACPGWRWMPGMRIGGTEHLLTYGRWDTPKGWGNARVVAVAEDGSPHVHGWADGEIEADHENGPLPDVDDPATLGCLLALVREVWRDDSIHCASWMTSEGVVWWDVESRRDSVRDRLGRARGATEAEALVAALEAAGGAK